VSHGRRTHPAHRLTWEGERHGEPRVLAGSGKPANGPAAAPDARRSSGTGRRRGDDARRLHAGGRAGEHRRRRCPDRSRSAEARRRAPRHERPDGNPNFDIHLTNSPQLSGAGAGMAWSQLLWYKNGRDAPNPNFVVEGDLAESWTQPDHLTYIFKLQPGMKFQNVAPVNGREVVADDLIWSYQRQISSKVNAGYLQGISKMEAPDKYTLKLTRSEPNPDFLANLGATFCKVVPHEVVDQKGDMKEGPVIGSGPWIMGDFDKGQSLKMNRNPDHYRKDRPFVDAVQFFRLPDPGAALNAVRSGNLEATLAGTGITMKDAETLKSQNPNVQVVAKGGGTRLEIDLNSNKPPFDNIKVRKAIHKGIDRDKILRTLYPGFAAKGTGFAETAPNQNLPAAEIEQLYKYDPDGAKKLLAEAGATDLQVDFLVANFLAGLAVATGELVQAQLLKIGVKTNLKPVEGTAFITNVRTPPGDYIMSLNVQAAPDPIDSELRAHHHSKGSQFTTGLVDPTPDSMIERQSRLVSDPAARARLIQDIQRKTISLYTFNQVAVQDQSSVTWPYVQDWNPNSAANNTLADYMWVWLDK
jgi:peptide/nickel transport system substrate-binding protein